MALFSDAVAASLPDGLGTEVRICAKNKEKGDKLKYEFKFLADPEPDKVSRTFNYTEKST